MMMFVTSSLDSLSKSLEQNFPSKGELVKQKNQQKFAALYKYNLPIDQYAIAGSGPLGIRGLREIADVDLIISIKLRDVLTEKLDIADNGKVKKIVFPDDNIEAFWEGSFYTQAKNKKTPTTADMISRAEIIDGLPFQYLQDVLYFKRRMNRAKDLEDIRLIEEWHHLMS